MQYAILFLFTIFSFNLISQTDNWLKEDDITYLVEVKADVSLQEVIRQNRANPVPCWERLKMAYDYPQQEELNDRLRGMLLEQIEAGELIAQTPDLKKELTFDEVSASFYKLDTVVTLDMSTYLEQIQIVHTEQRLGALRLKLNLAWNEAKNKLQTKVIGFYVIGDQYAGEKTFFYVSLPNELPKKGLDIHDKNWGWIGKSEPLINWETAEILKGSTVVDFVEEVFLEQATRKSSFPVYEHGYGSDPLSANQLSILTTTVDTIVTISPETYEQMIKIISHPIEAKDVPAARLELKCYLSMDLTQLFFIPQYITPMIAEETDESEVGLHSFYYIRLE